MVVAVAFGIAIYRFHVPLALGTVIALTVFAGLILWGVEQPVCTHEWFAAPGNPRSASRRRPRRRAGRGRTPVPSPLRRRRGDGVSGGHGQRRGRRRPGRYDHRRLSLYTATKSWIGVLLFYGFLASVLPVWLLLQPRDYINSFQLYFTLIAMLLGLILGRWPVPSRTASSRR